MARNLVNIGRQMGQMGDGMLALRTAVEIFTEICPDEIDSRILMARLYLHLGINLQEVWSFRNALGVCTILEISCNSKPLLPYILVSESALPYH